MQNVSFVAQRMPREGQPEPAVFPSNKPMMPIGEISEAYPHLLREWTRNNVVLVFVNVIRNAMHKLFLLIVVTSVCVGCTSTDYQAWEGRNSVIEGRGGTKKVVDGVDVWTNGDPPRKFRLLGIIDDERPGGIIPMAEMKHDIAKKAGEHGGDAVIIISSSSQLAGYYTAANVSTQVYGASATSYGSSTTIPLTRHTSKYAVIKYVVD